MTDRALQRAIVTYQTLAPMRDLDEAGREHLAAALATLGRYSGDTVAAAFLQWHETGQIRFDPRSLRKREPFLTGAARTFSQKDF